MSSGRALADAFSLLVGTGPGAGMSLMILLSGLFGVAVGLIGYSIPAVRNVEDILPDFDAAPTPSVATEAEPAQA
jgi:hypothetical protein